MYKILRDDREVRLTTDGMRTPTVEELVCDTAADIANLPDHTEVAMGSICYVIETGDMYMLNSQDVWVKQ